MNKIALLSGDGIGPEVINQAKKVLNYIIEQGVEIEITEASVGGASIEKFGMPLTPETLTIARESDAVLFGAVGGDQWDHIEQSKRPEKALLMLRKELDLFANLRPAILYSELVQSSSLKEHLVSGLDLLIVRELTSGIYFGEPRGVKINELGEREGFNTYRYTESEISRIVKVSFELAMQRSKKLCSVDKANVLEVTGLWREIVNEESVNYPEVEVSHLYVDNASMQLVSQPKQFDVIVTGNMFGDILSDTAAMLTGSIGMLPSASLNEKKQGLYEPVHGSAPDIKNQDKANPIATILSLEMLLRSSLGLDDWADALKKAVEQTIAQGYRTIDIASSGNQTIGTEEMGNQILKSLKSIKNG